MSEYPVGRYLGDFAAQLDLGDGHRSLVESTLPLRTRDSSGERVPTDFALVDHGNAFAPRAPYVNVGLPKRLAEGIELSKSGVAVVPPALGAATGERAGGSVFWGNAGGQDTDIVATPLPWGFQVLGYLRSAESPEAVALRLKLPAGAEAEQRGADGGVVIKRGDDELARISPPIAYDADGTQVDASYTLSGTTLTAHVAHRSAELNYPVVLDPVVYENFQFWYTNAAMDNTGWESGWWTKDGTGKFAMWFDDTSSWGRGFYIDTNTYVSAQDQAYWEYESPIGGPWTNGSYIYRADFNYVRTQNQNNCLYMGITRYHNYWEAQEGRCNDLNYEHFITCKAPDCSPAAGTGGNAATFLQYMRYDRFTSATVFLGGAIFYINDRTRPDITLHTTGHDDVWLSDTTVEPHFSGSDNGLGVKQFQLTVPGTSPRYRTHVCWGDRHSRCPSYAGKTDYGVGGDDFRINTNTVPEGRNTVEARVIDFAGNSWAQTWTMKVDRSGPAINVTGLSDGQQVDYLSAQLVDIQATDPYSGVKSIEILVDDARQEITQEQACDAGGCPMSRTWLFVPANYGPGSHKIEIKATDQIGHTSVRTYQVQITDPLAAGGPA